MWFKLGIDEVTYQYKKKKSIIIVFFLSLIIGVSSVIQYNIKQDNGIQCNGLFWDIV